MAEREADLARVEAQVKSLRQVEAEQQNIIDKLAVGEAYGRVPVEGTEEGSTSVLLYDASAALGDARAPGVVDVPGRRNSQIRQVLRCTGMSLGNTIASTFLS